MTQLHTSMASASTALTTCARWCWRKQGLTSLHWLSLSMRNTSPYTTPCECIQHVHFLYTRYGTCVNISMRSQENGVGKQLEAVLIIQPHTRIIQSTSSEMIQTWHALELNSRLLKIFRLGLRLFVLKPKTHRHLDIFPGNNPEHTGLALWWWSCMIWWLECTISSQAPSIPILRHHIFLTSSHHHLWKSIGWNKLTQYCINVRYTAMQVFFYHYLIY